MYFGVEQFGQVFLADTRAEVAYAYYGMVGVSRTLMTIRPPSLLYLMAFDIRLRMIVFTMSTSHGTVIGPGMSYSTRCS